LTGVNRALVRQGLEVMAGAAMPGWRRWPMSRASSRPRGLSSGLPAGPARQCRRPRRRGRSRRAAALTDDPDEARRIAIKLDQFNRDRQEIERQVLDAGDHPQVDSGGDPGPVVHAFAEGWHPGVIGIVASRLEGPLRRARRW
jgi:single-stranded-DNA-specific exonuclease